MHGRPTATVSTSAELLNDQLLLIPVIEGYDRNSCEDHGTPSLYVYNCSRKIEGRVPYQDVPRVATFRFPQLAEGAGCRQICSTADEHGIPRFLCVHKPFVPDPALRLVAFQLELCNNVESSGETLDDSEDEDDDCSCASYDPYGEGIARLLLFVHAGTFARFCNPNSPGAEVPWEAWAPNARLMLKPSEDWLNKDKNHRRIFMPEGPLGVPAIVMLYDFAPPYALRRAVLTGNEAIEPWEYVIDPTVLAHTELFKDTVSSGLPFRKVNTGYIDSFYWGAQDGRERHEYKMADDCVLSRPARQENK